MWRFRSLLVYVDAQGAHREAVERAAEVALEHGAKLTIVSPREEVPRLARLVMDAERVGGLLSEAALERLEALAAPLRGRGLEVDVALLEGKPAQRLVELVREADHDLLVTDFVHALGPVRRALLRSLELRLLRECPKPVWMVKPHARRDPRRFLAALDPFVEDDAERQLNRSILSVTAELARRAGGEAHAAFAWTLPGEAVLRNRIPESELEHMLEDARTRAAEALADAVAVLGEEGRGIERHLVKGYAWEVIPDLVQGLDAELLVMGTAVRTGLAGALIGNTSENLLQSVDCSLLVLK